MNNGAGLTLGYNGIHPFSRVTLRDRSSVQELLRTLLDPLVPFFSSDHSRIRVPGQTAVRFDQTASEIEGFCRPLWGLAFLLEGGGHYSHSRLWIDGLKAGTNPNNPEFWGYPLDNDQRMVEMCPIGVALAIAPQFWQALSDNEKHHVEQWLHSINSKIMPNTNWLWFRVFANIGLKNNNANYSLERLANDIQHLDTFYRGEGWSNDGPEGIHQMDYYSSSFAIQVLQLLYSKLAGEEDPEQSVKFKERARLMALNLVHYFDDAGKAIPFGRSTIYRFAMVAFWSALAYADVDLPQPLTWGMVKGIVLRNLRWWQTQKNIWSSSGTLTIGYSYPNMYMAENYNSPGSPYWACLSFICLAVPETHPFWCSSEEALGEVFPSIKALVHPGHIISHLGNHTMLLNSGQACGYPMKATHAKYGAFAYSSAFGFSVPTGIFTLGQYALASQLGLSDDNGEYWKTRRLCEFAKIEERHGKPNLVSVWKPFPDVKIKSFLIPPEVTTPNWHLRAHRIEAGREVMTADGSFAISNERALDGRPLGIYDAEICEGTFPQLLTNYDVYTADGWSNGSQGAFAVSKGAVGIKALEENSNRMATLVDADPNSNLLEGKTTIPTLRHTIKKGKTAWYISAIFAVPPHSGIPKWRYLDGWTQAPLVPDWLRAEMSR